MKMESSSSLAAAHHLHSSSSSSDYLSAAAAAAAALPGMDEVKGHHHQHHHGHQHHHHNPHSPDHVMASFSAAAAYSSIPSSAPSGGRKYQEGTTTTTTASSATCQNNDLEIEQQQQVLSAAAAAAEQVSVSTAYPYFASPSADLSSPLYASYSTTGVFPSAASAVSPRTAAFNSGKQTNARPKSSRANAGKSEMLIEKERKKGQLIDLLNPLTRTSARPVVESSNYITGTALLSPLSLSLTHSPTYGIVPSASVLHFTL